MSDELFDQKLQWFKQNEQPEVVLFIADRPDLAKIVITWTNTTVGRTEEESALPDECENATWEWLWENTAFSNHELRTKSGQVRHSFSEELGKLIGNRILYPDGTVNSFVQRYLRERVLSLFDPQRAKKRESARKK